MRKLLTARVIEERSKATSIQATPELVNDPAAVQKFQAVQGELTGALSKLMAVSENYPNLRANQGFRDLSAPGGGQVNTGKTMRGTAKAHSSSRTMNAA